MNINGISVRFRGDVHLPRCRSKRGGGVTNSFGNQEENGWRQGDMEVGGGREVEVALMKRRRVGRGAETRPRQERGSSD